MIAKLQGVVDSFGDDFVIIMVGGVGYLVFASSRTLQSMPRAGEAVTLVIETHVREDHIHLYGFVTESERDWYRLLTSVQGVGAKMGLAILSALTPAALQTSILAGDKKQLSIANGVGPKLAQRIATELKDKAAKVMSAGGGNARAVPSAPETVAGPTSATAPAISEGESSAVSDAASALVNLGYGQSEAFTAVATAAQHMGPDATVAELIRAGLKEVAPK